MPRAITGSRWSRPGTYSVTGKIPFRTTLINAVLFPETFDTSDAGTTFTYTVDIKSGEFHYNEVNVNDPRVDPFSQVQKGHQQTGVL